MTKATVTIRQMKLSDIGEAMKLSTAEGWNQTEADWRLLIENTENVSLLAEADNKVIATTTAINYSDDVAWVGMVLVNRGYRGLGVAKTLLTSTFEKLGSVKSIKLDATPAGKQVYEKLGFRDEYLIARMTNLSLQQVPATEGIDSVEPIQPKDIVEVVAIDTTSFGADRKKLIDFLIARYPEKAWVIKRDGNIAGFALGRVGTRYDQIGPVVASNDTDAQMLIRKALSHLSKSPVVVDVLIDKAEILKWLTETGFTHQRHFIRMYKDDNPFPGQLAKQYLICGPEFG